MLKSTFAILATLLAVSARHITLDFDTASIAGLKPPTAHFGCVIKSKRCKSAAHYTDVTYDRGYRVTTCHHDGDFKNIWDRVNVFGDAEFVNTVYVGCPKNGFKVAADRVQELLSDDINVQTNCEAKVQCYKVEDVDEKCFPKNNVDAKKGGDHDQ